MRTITTVRIAMIVLWLGLMVVDWDIVWLCLFAISTTEFVNDIDNMDY